MECIYKERGETPLESVNKFFLNKEKVTYAGRLDPMAEGLLLVLKGDECKNARHHFSLPKTYTYNLLWGVKTDTYDTLGIIEKVTPKNSPITPLRLPYGKCTFPYPLFSSKTVKGIPLWKYARLGKYVERPLYTTTIYDHTVLNISKITGSAFVDAEVPYIQRVKGDFRQHIILKDLSSFKRKYGNVSFYVLSLKITLSGGGYVRSIAEHFSSLAFNIKRIKIGSYTHPTL